MEHINFKRRLYDDESKRCLYLVHWAQWGRLNLPSPKHLIPRLEACGRAITLLDVVPLLAKQWCEKTSEGKLLRKGFVASEVVRHGGIAICVTVSARREVREAARQLVGSDHFVEVFVDVPPEVAAARKAKRPKKPPLLKRIRFMVRRLLNRFRPQQKTPDL